LRLLTLRVKCPQVMVVRILMAQAAKVVKIIFHSKILEAAT